MIEKRRGLVLAASAVLSFLLVPAHMTTWVSAPFFQSSVTINTLSFNDVNYGLPLTDQDKEIYVAAFQALEHGDLEGVKAKIKALTDERLLGHVLATLYLHPKYKSSASELKSWMEHYNDLPMADKIYALAVRKNNGSAKGIMLSQTHDQIKSFADKSLKTAKNYSTAKEAQANDTSRAVKLLLDKGAYDTALKSLEDKTKLYGLDPIQHDRILSSVAISAFYNGKYDLALDTAKRSADRSGAYAPRANWIAGLSYWREGDYTKASEYFSVVANSDYASGWLNAAGAYWAGRSYDEMGSRSDARAMYKNAAQYGTTFYGLLASVKVGLKPNLNLDVPTFGAKDAEILAAHSESGRAMLLAQAGQYDLAEEELLRVDYRNNEYVLRAALAFAQKEKLARASLKLSAMLSNLTGEVLDYGAYPLSVWADNAAKENESAVDSYLVHAVIRQESRFDNTAKSHMGARGVMQMMPDTGKYIAEKMGYDTPEDKSVAMNIRMGQDYLSYLLDKPMVQGDLFSLLVAYNAGPGNLARWKKNIQTDDPLLFIEMIPSKETRDYVERVSANYWIYKLRAGGDLGSMNQIAEGKFAHYEREPKASDFYTLFASVQ